MGVSSIHHQLQLNNHRALTAGIQRAELGFFVALASCGGPSAAARDVGITTAAVSKHLAQLEARIGLTLINRTTPPNEPDA
ncbi:MAG: putative HTH-type transcriptional regulator [Accumulibacter sp.]|nr:MAG: putative HTH-type transcriptional regulator [Accumulibacter sp.]